MIRSHYNIHGFLLLIPIIMLVLTGYLIPAQALSMTTHSMLKYAILLTKRRNFTFFFIILFPIVIVSSLSCAALCISLELTCRIIQLSPSKYSTLNLLKLSNF